MSIKPEVEGAGTQSDTLAGYDTLRPALWSAALLCGTFLCNFVGRVVFGPLLLDIEADLGLSHAGASRLFLLLALGYSAALLGSGFISARISHKRTVTLSGISLGLALTWIAFSNGLLDLQIGMVLLGLATGMYLPSGMTTLTSLVKPRLWGRVVGLHQLAPNLAMISAPLLAHWGAPLLTWRGVLGAIGVAALVIALVQAWRGKGGEFKGTAPSPARLWALLKNPNILVAMGLQGIGAANQLGIYSLIPAFLIDEHGLEPGMAQSLVSISRLAPIGMGILAGFLVDRWGLRKSLTVFCALSCLFTVTLGLAPSEWMYFVVPIQPLAPASLFPACFVAMSRAVAPELRNLSIGLAVPGGYLVGAGLAPAILGYLGDMGSFGLGFAGLGIASLGGIWLTRRLTFEEP